MNDERFANFLHGTADDRQQQVCEDLLANPETVVQVHSTVPDDSLISALRIENASDSVDLGNVRKLAERIEQLVPRDSTNGDELQQFLDPPMASEDIGMIGKYRIIEFLASGGSGLVFRGIDFHLQRTVCIKVLKPSSQFNDEAKTRFERESREAARLVHDRIVAVMDAGEQKGLPWFAMPMLNGCSLRARIQKAGHLDPGLVLRLARQIAEGLNYAHERGLLHRDIKPDNLWVDPSDHVKILDFGLARLADESSPITREGTVIGTPCYMSPEQVKGTGCDERSDLFSVGVVMVEMLTGQSPFKRENLFSTLMSIAGAQLDLQSLDPEDRIPAGIRQLVQDLLQIEPEKRVRSAADLIRRLDLVEAEPGKVQEYDDQNGRRGSGIWKAIAGGLSGIALCLAGLAIWAATDKGTLVVEASDPDVTIQIAQERVTVTDPVTDRTYEIKIGSTPLPSGFYQLETTDSSGELVFSSETISIRRGEQVIVSVSLKNPGTMLEQANAIPNRNEPQGSKSDEEVQTVLDSSPNSPNSKGESLPDSSWSDKSYDPVVRKNFKETLETLPAIEIYENDNAQPGAGTPELPQAFATRCIVEQPVALDQLTSWSIELEEEGLVRSSNNSDESLHVEVGELVRIRDREGNLKFILPIQGVVQRATFDTDHPNLIAVSSLQLDPNVAVMADSKYEYEITVWRLNDSYAELLFRLPVSRPSFAWDRGYRLFHFDNGSIKSFRLDNSTHHTLFQSEGDRFLQSDVVSPNGRFLATYSAMAGASSINLWDLKSGKFKMAIPDARRYQWKSDSSEIAIPSDRPKEYVIWKTDKPILEKRVLLPAEQSQEPQSNLILGTALESDFGRVAWVTRGGDLAIRNVNNNRQGAQSLVVDPEVRHAKLNWNSDGSLTIGYSNRVYRWTPNHSDVHGTIELIESTVSPVTKSGTRLQFSSVYGVGSKKATVKWDAGDEEGGFAATLDLANPSSLVNVVGTPIGESFYPSPDGTRMVKWDAGFINGTGPATFSFASIGDEFQPRELRVFGARERLRIKMRWTVDSQFLAFATPVSRTGRWEFNIFDRAGQSVMDVSQLVDEKTYFSIDSIARWESDKFLVTLSSVRNGSVLNRLIIDPATGQAKQAKMFDEFKTVTPLSHSGSEIVFTGRKLDDVWDPKIDSRHVEKIYKAQIVEEKGLEDLSSFVVREFDNTLISHDGDFALIQHLEGTVQTHPSGRSRYFQRDEDAGRITIAKWNNREFNELYSNAVGDGYLIGWHQHHNSAAWSDRYSMFVYDVPSKALRGRFFGQDIFSTQTQLKSGWLIAFRDRLVGLKANGELFGQVLFDPLLGEKGQPLNGRWIMANGAMYKNTPMEGLVIAYCKNERVFCQSLLDFVSEPNNPRLPICYKTTK